jgi:hypothetical protein
MDELKINDLNKYRLKKVVRSRIDLNKDDRAREIIESKFSDPNKYFELDDKVIIGKIFIKSGKKIKPTGVTDDIRTYKYVGRNSFLIRSPSKQRGHQSSLTNISSLTQFQSKIGKKADPRVVITDKGLIDYYESCKGKNIHNRHKVNECIDNVGNSVKSEMSKILNYQQGVLSLKRQQDIEGNRLRNNLSRRLGRSVDQILMNNVHQYREKQELENLLESSKPVDLLHGEASWLTSLRRPEDFKGTRVTYINVNSSSKGNPDTFWQIFKEEVPKECVIVRAPYKTSTSLDKALSNTYLEKKLTDLNIDTAHYGHRRNCSNLSVIDYWLII